MTGSCGHNITEKNRKIAGYVFFIDGEKFKDLHNWKLIQNKYLSQN